MHIISVQSIAGGTGVTLTAAEMALTAMAEGQSVLVVDTSPYACLKDDLDEAGFHYLDDVRQLFRPLKEARWQLSAMPRYGILHYPESQPDYVAISAGGGCEMVFRERAGREPDALFNLWRNVAWFYKHYDIMIVDVAAKDVLLMQYFNDVADEVHLLLRGSGAGKYSVDDWRSYIERPEGQNPYPKIIAHSDRNTLKIDVDARGNSAALLPFFDAARFPNRKAPPSPKSVPPQ